jgi:hypothetical protein
MASLLRIVGAVWAILGLLNIFGMPWSGGAEGLLSFGLMFNVVLFILPGLVLVGIGEAISRRSKSSAPATSSTQLSLEDRLENLDRLFAKGTITQQEHAARRAEILKET